MCACMYTCMCVGVCAQILRRQGVESLECVLSCCRDTCVPCSGLWGSTTQESLHCAVLATAV